MYYLTEKASRRRQREAQQARNNRAEIVKALSHGQITRRDLYKWGIFTATGMLALKNGLKSLRAQRPRCRAHRHAAQPAVRSAEIHPGDAAAGAADAGPHYPDAGGWQPEQRPGRVLDAAERTPGQAPFVPYRLHRQPRRSAVPESADRPGTDRRSPARRGVRAPALERVLPQGGLREVVDRRRAEQQLPPQFTGPGDEQRLDLWGWQCHRPGDAAAAPVQGPLRRADHQAGVQQHAGRPHAEQRLWSQRDRDTFPQCA